jgi:hypothetical protein
MTVLSLADYRRSTDRVGRPVSHARRPRRRALAHQCTSCGQYWAMEVVQHPSGTVVLCRHCGALRSVSPHPRPEQPAVRVLRALDPGYDASH